MDMQYCSPTIQAARTRLGFSIHLRCFCLIAEWSESSLDKTTPATHYRKMKTMSPHEPTHVYIHSGFALGLRSTVNSWHLCLMTAAGSDGFKCLITYAYAREAHMFILGPIHASPLARVR